MNRSHFLEELTGEVHLSHFDVVSSIEPDLARGVLESPADGRRAPASDGRAHQPGANESGDSNRSCGPFVSGKTITLKFVNISIQSNA